MIMNTKNLSRLKGMPLLLAAAALAACSSDQPAAAPAESQQWTLVVGVCKTDAPIADATRGVQAGTGETLISKWTAGTTAEVYDEADNLVGTLVADASNDGTTTLRGTVSGTSYTPGESTLTLYSPSRTLSYGGQTGTIASISQKDFLYGTVTVQSVSMQRNMLSTTDCQFTRLQAFTKFTFEYPMKSVQISADGLEGSPLTITTAETETSVFYVALRNAVGVEKLYSFFGTAANGTTTFLGTKLGTLYYNDYSTTGVNLQPSVENGNVTADWTNETQNPEIHP